jgi:hypothetical protein
MPYIANKPGTAYRSFTDKDTFTGDGSTVAFDMTYAIAEAGQNDLQVFVNDVRQIPGDDYTLGVDDTGEYKRITFTSAPTNSHAIVVLNPGTVQGEFSSVADNAVTTAKLFDGAVTTGKLAADAVDGTKIADDAIDSEHITDGSVDNVHLANSNITINGTSIALGASGDIVAGTDWQSVIVADGSTTTTAEAGKGYFIDTTSAAHTITLPASPSLGDLVTIVDYASTFATNNVTVNPNGNKIEADTANARLETNAQTNSFVYVDSTQGWKLINQDTATSLQTVFMSATGGTVSTTGDYKIHTFNSSGCFVVSTAATGGAPSTVDYLVVAGGGGAGQRWGGGGGAGGFRESHCATNSGPYTASPLATTTGISVSAQTYPITVGAGGAGVSDAPTGASSSKGSPGSNSIFSTITSAGGGGSSSESSSPDAGLDGGSGGGSEGRTPSPGSSGNTPPVSPPQGNNGAGATGSPCGGDNYSSGGGGGALAAGNAGFPANSAGGGGATTEISGSSTAYAGGGGGSYGSGPGDPSSNHPAWSGAGGAGGGGNGGGIPGPSNPAENGTSNTGGGGGGGAFLGPGGNQVGGSGGSGIVVIRYKYQ